jgi:hypothetical protein
VAGLEGSVLPCGGLVQDGVGDGGDEVGRDVDPVELLRVLRIDRVLRPRAYIDTILASNSGKRR